MALTYLEMIVDLYLLAMREPPPLYCETSAAWAEASSRQRSPERAARNEWTSQFAKRGEDKDPEHVLVLGGVVPLEEITGAAPKSDESGGGWDDSEPTRLGRWAHRLWDPILAHEKITAR